MNQQEIQNIRTQFDYYRTLADKTILILSQDELNHKLSEESNSVAMIVRHITGNLLSRFTNFFTEDGEKTWRKRDEEFEDGYYDRHELIANWDKAWKVLFEVLDTLTEEDSAKVITIRKQEQSVAQAIFRQLAHYPYHIGQIVFIGKVIRNYEWQSLSIPKNKSEEYNQAKFSNPDAEIKL